MAFPVMQGIVHSVAKYVILHHGILQSDSLESLVVKSKHWLTRKYINSGADYHEV